jgi:hypothetical protein
MSKRSGDITVSRKLGIDVTPGGASVPSSKGPAGSSYITVDKAVKRDIGVTPGGAPTPRSKAPANGITVDRSVTKPPTRKPAK